MNSVKSPDTNLTYEIWVRTINGYQRIVCTSIKQALYVRDNLRSIEDWNSMI